MPFCFGGIVLWGWVAHKPASAKRGSLMPSLKYPFNCMSSLKPTNASGRSIVPALLSNFEAFQGGNQRQDIY
jgi:hypothetical protein